MEGFIDEILRLAGMFFIILGVFTFMNWIFKK